MSETALHKYATVKQFHIFSRILIQFYQNNIITGLNLQVGEVEDFLLVCFFSLCVCVLFLFVHLLL